MTKRNESEQPVKLGVGAAAVLDVLGFKAARKAHGAERLVASVQRFRRLMKTTAEFDNLFGGLMTTTAAFSDAVILTRHAGKHASDKEDVSLVDAVEGIAVAASQVITSASVGPVPLAFRGCIAAGSLLVVHDIFVGDAIDDAAEFAEQALAAIVWLTPRARVETADTRSTSLLLPWDLPLHGRGTVNVLTVNPFWASAAMAPTVEDTKHQIEEILTPALLRPFNSSAIDVVQKRQNTEAFLKHAAALTLERWEELQENSLKQAIEKVPGGESA